MQENGFILFCFVSQCWLMFRGTIFLGSVMFGKNTRPLAKLCCSLDSKHRL